MVKAGPATDATIDGLLPLLDDDDILIDGGNTNYQAQSVVIKHLLKVALISSEWECLVEK